MDASRVAEQIHARLLVRYGAQWIRMWDGIDPAAVRADWAEQVGYFGREAIQHALEHLPPDRPPNAAQFKALCLAAPRRPVYEPPGLERPDPTPEDKSRVREMLARAKAAITGR